jgi:peptidylprolyl isomerase
MTWKQFAIMLAISVAPFSPTLLQAQEVAARMGQTDVKLEEIDAFIKSLGEAEEQAVRSDPGLISQAVRLYLTNRIVLKEALDKKWDAEAEVKTAIERAREGVITETYLQNSAKLPEGFPSSAEVQAFYNANAQSLFVPRQFQISQIFIAAPKDGDAAAKDAGTKKLAAVQAKLKAAGADFAAIAKSDSDLKATAERGGEIGWVAETQLRPELLEKVSTLPKGSVSEPVQLEDGYHILKLNDTRSAGPLPLAEVQPRIVATLREQRRAQARRAFVAQILEKSPITLNEFVLAKLARAPQAGASATGGGAPAAGSQAAAPAQAARPAAPAAPGAPSAAAGAPPVRR